MANDEDKKQITWAFHIDPKADQDIVELVHKVFHELRRDVDGAQQDDPRRPGLRLAHAGCLPQM